MKKILIISTNSNAAGAPLHVEQIVTSFKNDYNFKLYFGREGIVSNRLLNEGYDVKNLNKMSSKITPIKDIILIFQLAYEIYKFKPDIIHLHSSKAGIIGRIAGLLTKTKTIFTIHGWSWQSAIGAKSRLFLYIEKLLNKITRTEYIFVSNAVYEEGIRNLGENNLKGQVILNGVNDYNYKKNYKRNKPLRLLMPARVSYPKDHFTLAASLKNLNYDYEMIFCGEGTESQEFKEKVYKIVGNQAPKFKFLGNVLDMKPVLHYADIFILISHSEGLPLSLLEAMSVGLPVIASNVGGIEEAIIHNYNGYLIPKVTVNDIVKNLQQVFNSSDLSSMSKNSRIQYETKFKSSIMLKKLRNVYDN